jgi:RimJ/RimL family protein N-acetyltransferase
MQRSAPEIRTDRLRLRAHRRDDAEALIAMWQDPVVVRHFGGQGMAAEDTWNRLLRYVGHWAVNGYGMWVVEEAETGARIGEVGLFEGRRGLGARFDEAPEAGWVLLPLGHGKGYAREAMTAALVWAECELALERTVCIIDPANLPSIRTAESLGFRPFGTRHYKGNDVLMFERLKP